MKESRNHQKKAFKQGFYWPTVMQDAKELVKNDREVKSM